LIQGRVFTFWLLALFIGIMLYSMQRAKSGKPVKVRRLPALDAIDEAMGRATEMGRPVHYTPGLAAITGLDAPQTLAAISILGYVSKLAAQFDVRLIVTIRQPEVYPLALETVREAYQVSDKIDKFVPTDIRYLSNQQFAYAAAASGIIVREKVAANFMMGAFWAENLMLAEVGTQVNAFQISGTASLGQVPLFVATTDYFLIGEELYAASAYLSQDPVQLGSVFGQDICKMLAAALLVIGVLGTVLGSDFFINLLSS
jgi:hypothetical protein